MNRCGVVCQWVVVSVFGAGSLVAAPFGEVRLLKGYAQILRSKSPILLSKVGSSTKLKLGDRLHTDSQGEVRFSFGFCEGELAEQSYLDFRETAFGLKLWLSLGGLQLRCEQPTEVLSIQAWVEFGPGSLQIRTDAKQSWLRLSQGTGQVSNLADPSNPLRLKAGDQVEVVQLNQPKLLPPEEKTPTP